MYLDTMNSMRGSAASLANTMRALSGQRDQRLLDMYKLGTLTGNDKMRGAAVKGLTGGWMDIFKEDKSMNPEVKITGESPVSGRDVLQSEQKTIMRNEDLDGQQKRFMAAVASGKYKNNLEGLQEFQQNEAIANEAENADNLNRLAHEMNIKKNAGEQSYNLSSMSDKQVRSISKRLNKQLGHNASMEELDKYKAAQKEKKENQRSADDVANFDDSFLKELEKDGLLRDHFTGSESEQRTQNYKLYGKMIDRASGNPSLQRKLFREYVLNERNIDQSWNRRPGKYSAADLFGLGGGKKGSGKTDKIDVTFTRKDGTIGSQEIRFSQRERLLPIDAQRKLIAKRLPASTYNGNLNQINIGTISNDERLKRQNTQLAQLFKKGQAVEGKNELTDREIAALKRNGVVPTESKFIPLMGDKLDNKYEWRRSGRNLIALDPETGEYTQFTNVLGGK